MSELPSSGETFWCLSEKWHRVDKGDTHASLCGISLPSALGANTSDEVIADVRANKTTVCGSCDRIAALEIASFTPQGAASSHKASRNQARGADNSLTEEQRKIRDRLEKRNPEAAARRAAQSLDAEARGRRSRSVRTVSGGLPTQGKKR